MWSPMATLYFSLGNHEGQIQGHWDLEILYLVKEQRYVLSYY